jgi:hypothetical protein
MSLTKLEILGEGALAFHVTAVLPLWSELTIKTDSDYPLARNILLIILVYSVPYLVCLLLSHGLYRYTETKAPILACTFSVAMFSGTLFFWYVGNHSGEKGIMVILLIILQHLVGMISFGALKYYYRKPKSTTAGSRDGMKVRS